MRQTILVSLIVLLPALGFAQQDVKLVNPDTFCKVDQFGAQKGKAASGNFKKCESLKDKTEIAVKSLFECKQRALTKGEECLKLAAAIDLAAGGKFIEKFSVSFNSTNFTCAVSQGAGNACP